MLIDKSFWWSVHKITRGSTVTLPYFCWYLAAISWRCLFVRAPRTATIASLSLPVGWKKEELKLSKLHLKSWSYYQPRPTTLTRRPWLFRMSQKPNPTIVYFSSPDPAMAFLSASASFSGSKLSAGFNVPWNSAWKKEFEMHKVQVTVRATCTSVRWILHWREHVKANVLLWVPEAFYSRVRRVTINTWSTPETAHVKSLEPRVPKCQQRNTNKVLFEGS